MTIQLKPAKRPEQENQSVSSSTLPTTSSNVAKSENSEKRRLGWFFTLAGWSWTLCGAYLGWTNFSRFTETQELSALILSAVGWMMGFAGSVFLLVGRPLKARDVDSVLEEDPRPPVLFLRSFRKDEALPSLSGLELLGYRTGEQNLESMLDSIGPVIAIGDPQKDRPTLGAARKFVRDVPSFRSDNLTRMIEEPKWQRVVDEYMREAALVVISISATEASSSGLDWEICHALDVVVPERLLLIFPSPEEWNDFLESHATASPMDKVGNLTNVRCLGFKCDWTPIVLGRHAQRKADSDYLPGPDYSDLKKYLRARKNPRRSFMRHLGFRFKKSM